MDLESAKRIQNEVGSHGFMYERIPGTMCLDGDFSEEELEAALVLLRDINRPTLTVPVDGG